MEKFKPEYLTPYLPYSLKVMMDGKKTNVAWMSTKNIAVIRPDSIGDVKRINWDHAHLNIKPLLHPLSRLTEPILEGGKIPIEVMSEMTESKVPPKVIHSNILHSLKQEYHERNKI